jgi:hypothetical protein
MVEVATAVENDRVDAGCFRSLAYHFADHACFDALGSVGASPIEHVLFEVTGGYQRPPSIVVDNLRVYVRG